MNHVDLGRTSSIRAAAAEWSVRAAAHRDLPGIAAAVRDLLLELGATPAALESTQDAARALLETPTAGTLLVADTERELVGFLGVSWPCALRVPGRYGLIQELWVRPAWRSQAIGAELLARLFEIARDSGIARVEVCLPGEGFSHLAATEAFYLNNGFTRNGVRMRRLVG